MAATDIEISPLEGCTLVRPSGPRLDFATATVFKNAVVDLVNTGTRRVVVSLSRLEQIDSSGLGALIALHKTLCPPGARLVVCEVPARISPIFKLTRLDRVLAFAPDLVTAAALARTD